MDSSTTSTTSKSPLLSMAFELQVHWLTFLRAYDLGVMQQTCHFYSNPVLIDATVRKLQQLYEPLDPPSSSADPSRHSSMTMTATPTLHRRPTPLSPLVSPPSDTTSLTFRELRYMEMRAVTKALQRPEPSHGYFVSKSWCKHALKWLETQQQETMLWKKTSTSHPRRLSKKKMRLQQRRLSDASPPWPNVNSDLLCPHNQMACSKARSARRLDKQAWKILKKLYPDSTQLATAVGECVQCSLERETQLKHQTDMKEKETKARKEPLQNPEIRRFYTRTRGFPTHMLRPEGESVEATVPLDLSALEISGDRKLPASEATPCPLKDANYVLLPRAWCHGWRRWIRTGQGECGPPHAGSILCVAHGMPLLPPHVEQYLQGLTNQLLDSVTNTTTMQQQHHDPPFVANPSTAASLIPGQAPDDDTMQALRAAGLSVAEMNLQLAAMRSIELQRPRPLPPQPATEPTVSRNALLDRENHVVVEILTVDEFLALEQLYSGSGFGVSFQVEQGRALFETNPCRKCDATGRICSVTMRNRSIRNQRKSAGTNGTGPGMNDGNNKPTRAGATLEY